MINKTILVGRLTKDPELKKTQSGKSVVSFTIACNRRFGEKDQADFINCVAWNHSADFLSNYIQKGALLGIEGRIQTRSYDDKDGKKVYVQEVLCESVQALESRSHRNEPQQAPNDYEVIEEKPLLDITTDDLPF